MIAALHYWERHNVRRAEALLEGVPAEFNRRGRSGTSVSCAGKRGLPSVRSIKATRRGVVRGYSPDGWRIASGSRDGK